MAIPRAGDGNLIVNDKKTPEEGEGQPVARSQTIDEFVEEYEASCSESEKTYKRVEQKQKLIYNTAENLVDEIEKLFSTFVKATSKDYFGERFLIFKEKHPITRLCTQATYLSTEMYSRNSIVFYEYDTLLKQLLRRDKNKKQHNSDKSKVWDSVKRDITYAIKNGSVIDAERHYTRLVKVRGSLISRINSAKEEAEKKAKNVEDKIDKKLAIFRVTYEKD